MILLNDFQRQWEDTGEAVLQATAAVGESGWYILGQRVRCFETALAEAWGAKYAVGVASGLDAIEISLKAIGCKAGDKVLTTPLSAFATTLAIVKLGAVPVFADTDEYGLIDLGRCREILAANRGIRFLLPVHLYGHALDMAQLRSLRDEFECLVVEDCGQSILASFAGIRVGTVGDLAATSFYPTKNLGAIGDGGAILTDRGQENLVCRALRDYGQTGKYRHDYIGYNSRMDELQAAILVQAFLPRLTAWTDRRCTIAGRYCAGIRNLHIRVPGAPPGSESVWHLFPVLVDPGRKRAFQDYLATHGVASGEHYPMLIPFQKALAGAEYEMIGDCERAATLAASEVSLPIHAYLRDSEIDHVIHSCNQWEG